MSECDFDDALDALRLRGDLKEAARCARNACRPDKPSACFLFEGLSYAQQPRPERDQQYNWILEPVKTKIDKKAEHCLAHSNYFTCNQVGALLTTLLFLNSQGKKDYSPEGIKKGEFRRWMYHRYSFAAATGDEDPYNDRED